MSFGAEHRTMGESIIVLRRASERDLDAIISLIDGAAEWLRTKNTDQWSQPWPSVEDRSHRILRDLRAGKTWIAWDGSLRAATITADSQETPIWPAEMLQDRAVYVCRLVVIASSPQSSLHMQKKTSMCKDALPEGRGCSTRPTTLTMPT